MSEDSLQPEHPIETSEAQFGMRALLGATTCVALFAALAGVVLKQYPPDARPRLVTFWGLWLAGLIGYLCVAFWQRRQAEREMGRVLFQLKVGRFPNAEWLWLTTIAFLVFGWYMVTYLIADGSKSATIQDWALILTYPVMLVWTSANSIAESLWLRHLQFRDLGILWGRTALAWDEVVEYRWPASRKGRLEIFGIDGFANRPSLAVPIGPTDQAAVTELLNSKLSGKPRISADSLHVSISQLPLGEVMRKAHVRRHYFFLALSVFVGLTLGYLGVIQGTGTREFDAAVLFALYLFMLIAPSFRQGLFRRHGAPIVRVFARREIRGFAAFALLALGVYYLAKNLLWLPAWFGYLFGVIYSYLTIATFGYYLWTQLDLCADEVVMPNAFRWPWDTIRLRSWNRERGRLVLGHGWRRAIAYVPPEQRETVDSLLREKSAASLEPTGEATNEASPDTIVQQ